MCAYDKKNIANLTFSACARIPNPAGLARVNLTQRGYASAHARHTHMRIRRNDTLGKNVIRRNNIGQKVVGELRLGELRLGET